MATKQSARLSTNLVGRKIHLMTDEEAREAGKRQGGLDAVTLATLTAESWWPAIKDHKKRFGDKAIGEIVAVHLGKDSELVYTVSFNGELVNLFPEIFRLEPEAATTEVFPIE